MSIRQRKSAGGRLLLVDLGNTRLKWAWLGRNRKVGAMHAKGLPALRAGDRVFAVSVAATAVRRRFIDLVRRRTGSAPLFAESTASTAGVKNGYHEPWRLGADRWVALQGAITADTDVLVVDVGTAVTIDLLDASGQHHGGFILPGVELMAQSLFARTGGIRQRAATGARKAARRADHKTVLFGTSTREAVGLGALHAIAASVDEAVRKTQGKLGKKPLVLLTGGDARRIARLLVARHEVRPKLVLEGLAQMLANSP